MKQIIFLFFFVSCSMGTTRTGGEHAYSFNFQKEYTLEEIKEAAPKVITTSHREPPVGKTEKLFGKDQRPMRRIGILLFETEIQPTRSGLAGEDRVYLAASGKQILTENYLNLWEESINVFGNDFTLIPQSKMKKAAVLRSAGEVQEDFIKTKRKILAADDIMILEKGKKTTMSTVINPRQMQDLSFLLAPGYDLMGGPKWSEHKKHLVNDVAKELKLDALILVKSDVSWSYPEGEMATIKLKASTIVPLSSYHERLEKVGDKSRPNVTLCLNSYLGEIKVPVKLLYPEKEGVFSQVEEELILPMMSGYNNLSQMMISRIFEDLRTLNGKR